MTLFALPVVGFMLVFPDWLMWLFGEEYKNGSNLLRILALVLTPLYGVTGAAVATAISVASLSGLSESFDCMHTIKY